MSSINLNNKTFFTPIRKEMAKYYKWFKANPPPKIPQEVIYQGAGTEVQMPFMHFATVAPAYVIAGRYLKELGNKLKRPPKILEIGCGTGIGAYYLKTQVIPEADISAIDFSEEAMSYAQKHYAKSDVKYKTERAQRLPFEDGQFDLVISVQVLEHISKMDAIKFVEEVDRVLKKGGVALISTPNRELCQDLYCDNPEDTYEQRLIPSHEHEYYKNELKKLFGEAEQNRERLFAEVQVNSQVNLVNRKQWIFGLNKLRSKENILGNLKLKLFNFSRKVVPLDVQNWIGRKTWEATMKARKISYKNMILANEYHPEAKNIQADSFFVVVKK